MTDARFPERWLSDRRLQRLSDAHFRAFITSLTWSVSNRTNGVIEPEDLALIPNFAANSAKAFVKAGLWSARQEGWLINDFGSTQTSSEQLAAAEAARRRERDKKARQRAAKRAADQSAETSTDAVVPGDVPGDNTGQDRPGKDRPGPEVPHLAAVGADQRWRGAGPDPYDEYK